MIKVTAVPKITGPTTTMTGEYEVLRIIATLKSHGYIATVTCSECAADLRIDFGRCAACGALA